MKQTSFKSLLQWVVAVLLMAVGLHQAVATMAWNAASQQQLVQQVQTEYVPKQALTLYQQLEPLAQAAGVQPTELASLESRLASAVDIAITGKEIAQVASAGTEMKAQVQQQLDEKGITANEEIAALMDTLEQEGNRLEQQAWQLPATEQLQELCQQVQQKQVWLPTGGIAALLVLVGVVVLVLQRKMAVVFAGVAAAATLSYATVRFSFAMMQVPQLELGESTVAGALNTALHSWISQVTEAAEKDALVLAVVALIFVVLFAVQMVAKKKSR